MATSLLSLALQRELPPDVAMTGEITLTGLILPVGACARAPTSVAAASAPLLSLCSYCAAGAGGITEKIVAAQRCGVRTVVLPEGNRKHFNELQPHLTAGLHAQFVSHYDQLFDAMLRGERG